MLRSKVSLGIGLILEGQKHCTNFLKRGDALPSKELILQFYTARDNQIRFLFPIYLGNDSEDDSIIDQEREPSFTLEIPLPTNLGRGEPINLIFQVSENFNLHIKAECGNNQSTTIDQDVLSIIGEKQETLLEAFEQESIPYDEREKELLEKNKHESVQNNVRYKWDFTLFPRYVEQNGYTFISQLKVEREELMCKLFNNYYETIGNPLFFQNNPKRFSTNDFLVIDTELDFDHGLKIIYVSLPDEHEGSIVYCTAYAFVYLDTNEKNNSDYLMFTIEKSVNGTSCIASMRDGDRCNLGEATGTVEGDIEYIKNLIEIKHDV